jgi:NADH-quinone oxidoreductase subunit N
MALVYGASAATGFADIAAGLTEGGLLSDSLTLVGVGLISVGLAFKISIAPFHQWTPDVYQGAPTPVTAFMSAATKLAAFAVFIRFFLTALEPMVAEWDVILAVLATISILVGNVGAISQTSLKRMLGYSGIAQAGYMLAGIVVATQQGVDALTFYLAGYLAMNLAAFAAIVIHERQAGFSDSIPSLRGIGRSNPIVAWPLTIAMLALAGLPPTVGFIGKLYLFQALVEADWTWLGVMIAIGTMISLVYYMRVVATIWMSPEPEASLQVDDEEIGADPDASRRWYLTAPAVIASAAAIFFGIIPQPLVEFAQHAGNALAAYIS